MKKILAVVLVISFSFIIGNTAAAEENSKDWSVKLDATLNSKYVWRGINLVDDYVFQPSFSGTYKWFTVGVWGSMETSNENLYEGHGDSAGDFTEIDYIFVFANKWKKVLYSIGSATYTYPNTDFDPTTEIIGSLGADVILTPTITVYKDVDLVEGVYGTFGVSYKFADFAKISDSIKISATFAASVGAGSGDHNEFYYGYDKDAFTDTLVSAGLPVTLGKYLTFTPSAYYSAIINQDIIDLSDKDDNFWWGVSVTASY